jgi:hypothetical protein
LPLLTTIAVAGLLAIHKNYRNKLAVILLLAGIIWAIPGITVDILSGYANLYDNSLANFQISAYPPFSAWKLVDHWFATTLLDNTAIDIFWFRFAHLTNGVSLIPFFVCLISSMFLLRHSIKKQIIVHTNS